MPTGENEGTEPLAQAVSITVGDTMIRVVVLDAAACLTCDASLAPFLDSARQSGSNVRVWLSHIPTREQVAQLAVQRVRITGVVPTSVLPKSRLPVVVWRDSSLKPRIAPPDASALLWRR